ncbi:MAG TPA: NapC/NirT family cytochrome c [Candidatus Sulfotelmatobacter sp.]|nr:NapC/NirT family cytochrome c [Candidatus Sulfotelmatobacter sp.]
MQPVYFLGQNPVTLTGAVITTSTALTTIAFWFYDIFLPGPPHPYIGLLVYLILPGIFVLGLLLIPIGIWVRRRKLLGSGQLPAIYPAIDLTLPVVRHTLEWVGLATMVNLLIIGTASYRGVEYMDSTNFCGTTCHTVMAPEYAAYQNSPHSRVACVECHIGPGAGWFVRSKVSGLRQVVAVTFHTYSRPIPSPVKYLRPARETCEQCHWPQRFTGDKFLVNKSYKDDEKNTQQTDVLLLKVGGRTWQGSVGIHGHHLADNAKIRYISTDPERQTIPVVDYTDDQGKTTEFISSDSKPTKQQLDKGEHRTMDCVDCHNRPTHTFELPENAVDKQMSLGRISPELPFIKKKAVEVLKVDYPTRDVAKQRILDELNNFYRTNYPQIYQTRRTLVQQAGDEIAAIYLRNIFPDMHVTWGVHPNNLGHNDSPGCFRCHDGSHTSADGQTITNDCSACHEVLAAGEENPKILSDLGMK